MRITRTQVASYREQGLLVVPGLVGADAVEALRADYRDIVMICGQGPYAWKGLEDRASVSLRRCQAVDAQRPA